ncbi:MAG: hypothetical protein ACFE95_05065 [Candidatus Hodarchaeota archaeon]
MTEIHERDDRCHKFLKQSHSNLLRDLENQTEGIRKRILAYCGKSCLYPQIIDFFQELCHENEGIDQLISLLNQRYQEEVFIKVSDSIIHVTYSKCYCQFFQLNLIPSSVICECSCNCLKEFFEKILEKRINVQIIQSIARGAQMCEFLVSI